jgi:hypothetical protein
MSLAVQIITAINSVTNFLGNLLLEPLITAMDGWLSNSIISAVFGIVILVILKYTLNQRAITAVRDDIKAHMLALKLFKDSIGVTLRAQGRVYRGAFLVLFLYIRPVAVMTIPVLLLMAQMAMWYQKSPLEVGDEALLTLTLNDSFDLKENDVTVVASESFEITTGPIRVLSKNQVYWKIRATQDGYHEIKFSTEVEQFNKDLAVGKGIMRVSTVRPGRQWDQILYNPHEKPFAGNSIVESIKIDYPDRVSKTSGTNWWIAYLFAFSSVVALIFKPFFNVRI